MGRAVISDAQVRAAATQGRLVVPPGALVTPLAKESAADLSVELLTQEQAGLVPTSALSHSDLTARVESIVTALLANGGGAGNPGLTTRPRHVKLARQADVTPEPFGHPGPGPDMKVATVDVISSDDGSPMAAGYMTLTEGTFPWEFTYDEIQVVLEGELHIGTPEGVRIGHPGDIFYVPKGSRITFGTNCWTKFVYVTFPADWEGHTA